MVLHNFLRWAVILFGLLTLINALTGVLKKRPFTKSDNTSNLFFMISCDLQLVIGLMLYFGNGWFDKLKNFAHFIVIKNGSDGAVAWDGKSLVFQPAFTNNHVVDCIGAGDSFNAGFIREFVDKKPFIKCLETAALAGALNTTRAGGTTAFENPDKIRKEAWERFNYKM